MLIQTGNQIEQLGCAEQLVIYLYKLLNKRIHFYSFGRWHVGRLLKIKLTPGIVEVVVDCEDVNSLNGSTFVVTDVDHVLPAGRMYEITRFGITELKPDGVKPASEQIYEYWDTKKTIQDLMSSGI